MKKILIIYSEYTPTIDAIIYRLSDIEVISIVENKINEIKLNEYDLIVETNTNINIDTNSIKVHHSLLPAFDKEDPVKQAILNGAKVTGITVFFTNPFEIIAQYPVFISNDTHFDELEQELQYLEQTIYPIIIEKIIKNEPIESKDLINTKSNCGGCNKCNH